MKFTLLIISACLSVSALAQTNPATDAVLITTNPPAGQIPNVATPNLSTAQHAEAIRTACIHGRRSICGKILKVLPDGLVVDSGYTDLMRPPLNQSWLAPGTTTTGRTANLVEGNEPECVAVGLIFLTNLPKSRDLKPKQYDYVIIEGYPAGQYTYTSVGDIKRTVRRFTSTLPKAVELSLQAEANQNATKPDGGK